MNVEGNNDDDAGRAVQKLVEKTLEKNGRRRRLLSHSLLILSNGDEKKGELEVLVSDDGAALNKQKTGGHLPPSTFLS